MKKCLLLILLFASVALSSLVALAAESKPNVILIMADDFGYECVGANGGESYKTPNLDQLAARGLRFEHCYVQPLCTPTRVQLMTGKYNVRNYVEFGLLDKQETTFAHLLKKSGYATCIAGKWQLGHDLNLPAHFGFDEYCLWQLTRRPGRYKNPGLEINGKEIDYSNNEYGPDIVNDYALDFVKRMKDRPFFLYYPLMLTHDPYDPTPDSRDWSGETAKVNKKKKANSEEKEKKSAGHQHFTDMVQYMDKLLGKLFTRLDELGIRDNTLIIFLGDNGTGAGTPSQFKGRKVIGGKGSGTDAGMRVPLLANWPKGISAGRVSQDLIDSTDFLPTICAAVGATVPADLKIDGRSFLPQLRGEAGQPRDWIYSWYSRGGGAEPNFEFARDQRYKLYRDGRLVEVFTDKYEEQTLSGEQLPAAAIQAKVKLQIALDQFRDARPERFRNAAKRAEAKKKS